MDLDDFNNSLPWIRKEIHDPKETKISYFNRNSKMPKVYSDYYKKQRERHTSIMKSYLTPIWSLSFFDQYPNFEMGEMARAFHISVHGYEYP